MSELPDLLADVARKVRWAQWRRGVLMSFAVFLAGVVLVMVLDWGFPSLSRAVRGMVSLLMFVATAGACWKWLVVPLRRPLDLPGLARRIEVAHPELEESVSTALWVRDRAPGTLGEAAEKAAIRGLPGGAGEVARLVPSMRVARFTAGLLGLLLVAIVIAPRVSSTLLRRAVLPFSGAANVQAAELIVSPGGTVVGTGSELEISASGGSGRYFLEMDAKRIAMEATAAGARVVLADLNEAFSYRVISGAAQSAIYEVKVVPIPAVDGFSVRVVLPQYAGGEMVAENPALVSAIVGSKLVPEVEVPEGVKVTGNEMRELSKVGAFTWKLGLENAAGMSVEIDELKVEVVEDRVPEVRWIWPLEGELTVPPGAVLRFDAESEDDLGVVRSGFYAKYEGGGKEVSGRIDVAEFARRGIQEFSVTARAWDACPRIGDGIAQFGESLAVKVRIQMGSQDPALLALRKMVEAATKQARVAARALDSARGKLSTNAARHDREVVPKEDMIGRAEDAVAKVEEAKAALNAVAELSVKLPLQSALTKARDESADVGHRAAEASLQSSAKARGDANREAAAMAAGAKKSVEALEQAILEAGEAMERSMMIEKVAREQERRVAEIEELVAGTSEAWEKGRKMWAREQLKDANEAAKIAAKSGEQNPGGSEALQEALGKAAAEAKKAAGSNAAKDALDAARRAAASLATAAAAGKGESGEGSSGADASGKLAVQPSSSGEIVPIPRAEVSPEGQNFLGGGAREGDIGAGEIGEIEPGYESAVRAYFESLGNE